jgi:uncharacterized protein involved in exopolysaccharide biosynthesis
MYGVVGVSDGSDTERLVAEIDADLKARAKADPRTIREIVESSLSREFMTGATAAVERRIEEKRSRINQLRQERNERDRELAAEQDELERLERQLEAHEESRSAELQDALEKIGRLDADRRTASNEAVQAQAKKCGMTPEELLNEYER